MKRILGPVVAMALMVVLSPQASAQMPQDALRAGSVYGGFAPFNQAYGGFGFGYSQVLPSNSFVLDRYWMVEATPGVGTMAPAVAPAQAAAPVRGVARARPGRTARSVRLAASKSGARKSYPAAAQPTEPLPSGSLYWPGTDAVPLYSPAQRYESYGYGYDRSPVGSIDYGSSYKGYDWGY
jgi:hypothetical protein